MTTIPLPTSSNNDDKVEHYNRFWFTCHEKVIMKRMIDRGHKEGVKQALLNRSVWEDEHGTRLEPFKLFMYYEELTGERIWRGL